MRLLPAFAGVGIDWEGDADAGGMVAAMEGIVGGAELPPLSDVQETEAVRSVKISAVRMSLH